MLEYFANFKPQLSIYSLMPAAIKFGLSNLMQAQPMTSIIIKAWRKEIQNVVEVD